MAILAASSEGSTGFVMLVIIGAAVGLLLSFLLGGLPGKIARRRGHAKADSISLAGWIGAFVFGPLWIGALIWAYRGPDNGPIAAANDRAAPGPMNPLQIQLFTGAAAGRRARFDRSPITFGRDPSNMLVVEDAVVSRRHGEVRFEGGMWVLVNQSENGTKVNRKTVTDRPFPLRSGDEIYVGGKLLFNITFEPVEITAPGDLPLTADANAALPPPSRKKTKVWIGIGAYMGAMLLAVIFFSSLGKKPTTVENRVPELPKERIAELIREMPGREPASEVRYRESLTEANRLFDRRDTSPGGLYDAHRMYQTALTYSGRNDNTFPPDNAEAELKYRQVQRELIDKVELIYRDACNRLNRGDYDGAWRGFDQLKAIYKDGNSPLIENIQDKQNIAVARKGKGKIKVK